MVVYIVPHKRFVTLSNRDDWERLVSESALDTRHKALRSAWAELHILRAILAVERGDASLDEILRQEVAD